ncbi:hypothetical protein L7F22_043474 [Adiantum nelumboides]|nr:hypothetical protein [Adiantum nelumboides]
MLLLDPTIACAWLLFISSCTAIYTPRGNSVRLASIPSLIFVKGKNTAHRRSSALPQLLCVKGCEHEPAVVQCKNVRSYGRDVTWQCEADLPSHVTFSDIEVNCEGYRSKEDEDVLEGSCGLKYSLSSPGSKQKGGSLRALTTAALVMSCVYFMWNPRVLWRLLERT